jgi:type I restriction enzyme R subunit
VKIIEQFIKELEDNPVQTIGNYMFFVDECHHAKWKVAFGHEDPLTVYLLITEHLYWWKKTTLEVFGSYIHTYKFNEAVEDEVVKDLVYEGETLIKIIIPSKSRCLFEAKTKGLK